jgi:seryl-tRNA synthetase
LGLHDGQAKEDASEPLAKKAALEEEKARQRQIAQDAETAMRAKAATVGNIIHPDVPVSDNEVRPLPRASAPNLLFL